MVSVLSVLFFFSKIHGYPVMYRLAVAILACFTARLSRLAVLTGLTWRLAPVLEGPGGGPCFCSLFPIFI